MPQSTALQFPNIPLHIPYFSLSASSVPEKASVLSSSLSVDTIHASSHETSISIIPSSSEVANVQISYPPILTAHITMPMPSLTITQTSPLVSTGIDTSSIDEVRDEFNEDIVISLGYYHYRKSNKAVVIIGKKRRIDQGDGLNGLVTHKWMLQILLLLCNIS